MNCAKCECKNAIDWREYFRYEHLRKLGLSVENLWRYLEADQEKFLEYESIFLEYLYRK